MSWGSVGSVGSVSKKELIEKAKLGEVVSFPTDTVPALAALPEFASSIFSLKQRSPEKPLILMAANFEQLEIYITGTTKERKIWEETARKYWPGALTLVLPASDLLPKSLNPTNSQTIGLRIPNHPDALEILSQTGPLATTSANLSGQTPLENLTEIAKTFPSVFTLNTHLSGSTGIPSTIIKWTDNVKWQILRQGQVDIYE